MPKSPSDWQELLFLEKVQGETTSQIFPGLRLLPEVGFTLAQTPDTHGGFLGKCLPSVSREPGCGCPWFYRSSTTGLDKLWYVRNVSPVTAIIP